MAHLFYLAVATAWTYVFKWIAIWWVAGILFFAADAPPGDIPTVSKLVYSIGFPLFNFIVLTVIFFIYRLILNKFGIQLKKMVPILFNVMINGYLVWIIVDIAF